MPSPTMDQQIVPKALWEGGRGRGQEQEEVIDTAAASVAGAARGAGDESKGEGDRVGNHNYIPLPAIEWPQRAKYPEVEEKACYTCASSFSSLSSWRHECSECLHSFCATHCKDQWSDAEASSSKGQGRLMCIECFCSRRLAHVEEALFTAYDQAALSGQHVLPGRAVSPPSSGGAGREDSPWVDAVTLPGREEMQAGQVAVLASSPTSQTDSSVLNLVGSMVTSVFSSPTYVGKSVYSGLIGAARMATGATSPILSSPASPSNQSAASAVATNPSARTGVLGNKGFSPEVSPRLLSTAISPAHAVGPLKARIKALEGIKALEDEVHELDRRLAGAEAMRTGATVRIIHPKEGDVWFAGQACTITWVSRGSVRNLTVRIGSYVGSYVSSWQVIRTGLADTGNVTLALPKDTPTGWYCLRLSGSQGIVDAMSPYILIQSGLPPILLSLQVQDSRFIRRGGKCLIEWRKPRAGDEKAVYKGRRTEGDSSGDEEGAGETFSFDKAYGGGGLMETKQSDGSNDPGPLRNSEAFVRSDSEDEEDASTLSSPGVGGSEAVAGGGGKSAAAGEDGVSDDAGGIFGGVTLIHTTCKQAVNVQAIGEGASKESIDNVRRRALERELAMMSRATSQSKPEPGGGSKQEIQPLEAGGAIDSSYILEISSRYGYWKEIAKGLKDEGAYEWHVPRGQHQGTYLIRIRNGGATVMSGTVAATVRDSITFTMPAEGRGEGVCGSNVWYTGQERTITWESSGCVGLVQVSVGSQNGMWTSLCEEADDSLESERGKYVWKIPLSLAPGWYIFRAVNSAKTITGISVWTRIEYPPDDGTES